MFAIIGFAMAFIFYILLTFLTLTYFPLFKRIALTLENGQIPLTVEERINENCALLLLGHVILILVVTITTIITSYDTKNFAIFTFATGVILVELWCTSIVSNIRLMDYVKEPKKAEWKARLLGFLTTVSAIHCWYLFKFIMV